MIVEGQIEDREVRQAIKEYLRDKYGVDVAETRVNIEVVREAEPLAWPAEYRVKFKGEMRAAPALYTEHPSG